MNYFFSFPLTDFSRELPSVFRSELHAQNVFNLLHDTQTEMLCSGKCWNLQCTGLQGSTVQDAGL